MFLWKISQEHNLHHDVTFLLIGIFYFFARLTIFSNNFQFLFKKYLNYEKSQGDEERIEHVKRKAIEYAESLKWTGDAIHMIAEESNVTSQGG